MSRAKCYTIDGFKGYQNRNILRKHLCTSMTRVNESGPSTWLYFFLLVAKYHVDAGLREGLDAHRQ